jgi:DNA modification methylase
MNLIEGAQGDKHAHDWAQGETEAAYVIERMTLPGDLVVDPVCGSGTTLLAARRLGRRYFGVAIDPARARVAAARLRQGR